VSADHTPAILNWPWRPVGCRPVPSEKRARQRAGRQAKLEALAQRQKRRRQVRSSVIVVVIAVIVVGSVYLITRHGPAPATYYPNNAQGRLERVWVKAGCPKLSTERANTQKYKTVPKMTISTSATYNATVKTDVGTFVISLDPKEAPIAVNSFVFLADKGFYNCNVFHRVVKDFVDQTGDPTGTGSGGPGYTFTEAGPPVASPQYPLGAVALANSSSSTTPTTNESQWFVVTGPQAESLPPNYVLFGQVTSGMSVVQKINKDGSASTDEAGVPKVVHRILSVKIKEA
jgi:cyclophilin family peptidyl-prolyl cis-trans isomerase